MTLEKKKVMEGQDWSGAMGEKWNSYLDQFENMIAPIGHSTLSLAAFQPGERVLDIGCGGGNTSLEIARLVGESGEVVGLDIAKVLVDTANKRASKLAANNVRFECVDATSATLYPADFDVLFSRFGVMFFEEPVRAFENLHGLLKKGARLVFCCWAPPQENPWVGQLSAIVNRHITLPAPDPFAPGPFAFGDIERTKNILEQAGFSNIHFSAWKGRQLLGGTGMDVQAALDFTVKAFFVGEVLEGQTAEIKEKVLAEVRALFEEHKTNEGIALEATAWLVSARS